MALTHFDAKGDAHMVDVSDKAVTDRIATATAWIKMSGATLAHVTAGTAKKGDVLGIARIAGIQAAKRTPELIPLCHHVALSSVEVAFAVGEDTVDIETRAVASDKTGVEMEALTAASVAALTVYDMAKAVDKEMEIGGTRVLLKDGGKSGRYEAP